MKDHKVNASRGIPNFAYIPFGEAYKLARILEKLGGSGTIREFCELIGRKKTGWLGLQVKSIRAWGLISGKGKMDLTKRFYEISLSRDPKEKLMLKREAFKEIPLFKQIFEKYFNIGLPKKSELLTLLKEEYKINPLYAPSVSKTIIDSIQKYFKEYGKNYLDPLKDYTKKEIEPDLRKFFVKNNSINMKITSPIGNFDLEAANKEEFEKIIKIISILWDEERDLSENQKKGQEEVFF